jgi:hypothetical protein
VRLVKKWDVIPVGTQQVLFDDTYQRYARVDRQGQVSVRRVADDTELLRVPGYGTETRVDWSPNGAYLSTNDGRGKATVWHLTEAKAVVALPPWSNGVEGCYSPDSRQLAAVTPDGILTLYDLVSGQQVKRAFLGRMFEELSSQPTKPWLAMRLGNRLQIYDLEREQKLGEDLVHPARVSSWSWDPDGRSLAAACDNAKIYAWDLATRRSTAVLEGCRNGGITVAFNRTGDLLLSWGWEGMLRFWHPRTGKQVFSTPGTMRAHSFSPDDRHIAATISDSSGERASRLWEVAGFREYRTLVHDPVPQGSDQTPGYHSGSLHPNGRWLALGMSDGVCIWDVPSGRQRAWLPIGQNFKVWFEPSGALLTYGASGWWRWTMHAEGATASRLRIGPPDRLPVRGLFSNTSGSRDGRVLAVNCRNGAVVLHADRPYQPVRLVPHDDARDISVSPGGRWVATSSHSGTGIKLWEAATGKLVKELLPEHGMCSPIFSPDGRWLATRAGGDDCRLWAAGSWEPSVQIRNDGGWATFTADGRVIATSVALGVLALIDPATGREYARLEDPNQHDFGGFFAFTPDGTQLITISALSLAIHVWDLRLIRQQLAELGLDWDGPPFWAQGEAPDQQPAPAPPDTVEVQGLDLVTNPENWKQYQHGRTLLTLALNPFDAEAHFLLGQELLEAGKAAEAYPHFTVALTFRPGFGAAYVHRAQTALRLGRWPDAVANASVVLRDQPYDADTLSVRGQAYQKLGRHAEAEADFTAALARYPRSAQLQKLRAASQAALKKEAEAAADQARTRP